MSHFYENFCLKSIIEKKSYLLFTYLVEDKYFTEKVLTHLLAYTAALLDWVQWVL